MSLRTLSQPALADEVDNITDILRHIRGVQIPDIQNQTVSMCWLISNVSNVYIHVSAVHLGLCSMCVLVCTRHSYSGSLRIEIFFLSCLMRCIPAWTILYCRFGLLSLSGKEICTYKDRLNFQGLSALKLYYHCGYYPQHLIIRGWYLPNIKIITYL